MTDKVTIIAVKAFLNGMTYAKRGQKLEVTETRARDLERNGLVSRAEKAAQEPQNKKAPEPENKAAKKPAKKA